MLTQCPSCQTVFRITSTILRAAHGQVRCGRCNTQFDAINRLIDNEDLVAESSGTETETTITASKGLVTEERSPEKLAHEEITLEGNRIEISGVYPVPRNIAQEPETTHTETIIEEFNTDDEDWPDPDNEQDDENDAEARSAEASFATALAELEVKPDEMADEDLDALAQAAIEDDREEEPAVSHHGVRDTDTAPPLHRSRGVAREQFDDISHSMSNPAPSRLELDPDLFADSLSRRSPGAQWPWTVVTVLLAIALIGQVIHHERYVLVRHPSFGPQLTRLYSIVGQNLEPRWEMAAYDVKQWGIVSDPAQPGTLRVRASVTNKAAFAQPYPLLKLTLEDRFGGSVGTREFRPEEYLQSSARASRLLPAGEATNADISIVDPGEDAIGFHLDVCMNLAGTVRCST